MPVSAAAMAAHSKPGAVLLRRPRDAARPSSRPRRTCARRCASAPAPTSASWRAEAAIRAEIAYYRAHLHEGRDPESLHDLRVRCAEAMELAVRDARSSSTRCWPRCASAPTRTPRPPCGRCAQPGSAPPSSPTGTGRCTSASPRPGSRTLVDGAIASAEIGSAKPDGAIFEAALALVGARPERRLARRGHARGRRRGRARGRPAPGADRPRAARRTRPGVHPVRSLAELIPLAVP